MTTLAERVATIEANQRHIQVDVGEMKGHVSSINSKIDTLLLRDAETRGGAKVVKWLGRGLVGFLGFAAGMFATPGGH